MFSPLTIIKVRRRASNQSTEAAASAIADFLEVAANEESSSGWMLISTVNLLAAEGDKLVEVGLYKEDKNKVGRTHTIVYLF